MATWTTIPDADLTTGKPGKQYIFRALRDNIDAALSGDPSAPKVQSAAFADRVITTEKLADSTAGNYLMLASDAVVTGTVTTPTKFKESFIGRYGVFRVYFEAKRNTGGGSNTYAQIYVNGVATGTLRTVTSATYVAYSEDISGINKADLIQLYLTGSALSDTIDARYFRISSLEIATSRVIL